MVWWVMLAGGLGSGARYLVGLWAFERFGAAFPVGTLMINVAGCFALGVVAHTAAAAPWSPELRAAIGIGFLGGFTTYSSFNQETLGLLAGGAPGLAIVNVVTTVAAGLAAGWLGLLFARQLLG